MIKCFSKLLCSVCIFLKSKYSIHFSGVSDIIRNYTLMLIWKYRGINQLQTPKNDSFMIKIKKNLGFNIYTNVVDAYNCDK